MVRRSPGRDQIARADRAGSGSHAGGPRSPGRYQIAGVDRESIRSVRQLISAGPRGLTQARKIMGENKLFFNQ
jgi:hypothetical protein